MFFHNPLLAEQKNHRLSPQLLFYNGIFAKNTCHFVSIVQQSKSSQAELMVYFSVVENS